MAAQVRILALPAIIWGDREVVKLNGQKKISLVIGSKKNLTFIKKYDIIFI